ncbi:MFS transporter [Nocardia alba]|uniref:Putative MFS family arabinose efflux permease n=1 Tax=Nocardia alba TaxID=225051 RepID=A0A4R1FSL5_9NOCA|nr:MFS transporter [Nocardia alba]TCJ96624.1 putative MFS family arabinose efflux permease [Nocardia alba]
MDTERITEISATALRVSVVWFMALAAALATASVYLLQPAVAEVAGSLETSAAVIGTALAGGPIGYLAGLVLLVPLVDRFSPRTVVAAQFAALALASIAGAVAHSPMVLGLVIGVVGAGSAVGAQLSSVAGRFAAPRRRATVLGIVTAGISSGILAGRIVGGWLTEVIGWRAMLLVFVVPCVVVGAVSYFVLPAARGRAASGYLDTVRGMPGLFARFAALRWAAVRGALWFFAFCAVWAGLAVVLSQPPYSFSPERIGLYGCAGLAGVLATRIAGSWTDRVGPRTVILVGLALALGSVVALSVALSNTAATLVCLGLFDAGLFAAQVANQSAVLAIDSHAPARFNSAYMSVYFVGGSLGTAFGAAAIGWVGWPWLIVAAATATAAAGLIALADRARGGAGSCGIEVGDDDRARAEISRGR